MLDEIVDYVKFLRLQVKVNCFCSPYLSNSICKLMSDYNYNGFSQSHWLCVLNLLAYGFLFPPYFVQLVRIQLIVKNANGIH
jgi:hypothetical protein